LRDRCPKKKLNKLLFNSRMISKRRRKEEMRRKALPKRQLQKELVNLPIQAK
jgi:hypothetical protein